MSNTEFLKHNIQNVSYQHQRRNKMWQIFKIAFFIILVGIIVCSSFSYKVIFSRDSILSNIGRLPVIKQLRQLIGIEKLHGELDDRINFLLLGQGGVGHEGPYLTDTIILGTYKPSTNDVALISIPRDLFINIPDYGWHKINYANSIGETNDYKDGGAGFTTKVIENIFDLPIHYWLRIDFDAFKQIIDELNSITVCIDQAFEDHNYPTEDFDVQTVSFKAGCQNMDGDTALKFVRSRQGTNGEGSDFARAARQQKVILAIKDKILSLGWVLKPSLGRELINTVQHNIQTNIELSEIPNFLEIAKNIKSENIKKIVLDNSPKGLLRADISDQGAYVLLPRNDDYSELKNLAKNIFIIQNGPQWEPVSVIILNGTKKEGWARDMAGYLSSLNFKVLKFGNIPFITESAEITGTLEHGNTNNEPERYLYEKTVIYDLKKSDREDIVSVLKKSLDANVTDIVPEFLISEIEEYDSVDFLIVLGCNDCEIKEKEEE